MAIFAHLFDAKNHSAIARIGIKPTKAKGRRTSGVYATPQLASYELTHQWMRELRRYDKRITLAARFRIPDSKRVYIGRFDEQHLFVPASEAIAIAMNHQTVLGLEASC